MRPDFGVWRVLAVVAIVLACVAGGGCGGDDSSGGGSAGSETDAAERPAVTAAPEEPPAQATPTETQPAPAPATSASGRIATPRAGARVGGSLEARGTVRALRPGFEAWLVVQVRGSSAVAAAEQAAGRSGAWLASVPLRRVPRGERFTLSLLVVDGRAARQLERRGHGKVVTGSVQRVDSVAGLRRR